MLWPAMSRACLCACNADMPMLRLPKVLIAGPSAGRWAAGPSERLVDEQRALAQRRHRAGGGVDAAALVGVRDGGEHLARRVGTPGEHVAVGLRQRDGLLGEGEE